MLYEAPTVGQALLLGWDYNYETRKETNTSYYSEYGPWISVTQGLARNSDS